MYSVDLQKVQQQLKDGEAAAKNDASPVTVADYGTQTPEQNPKCYKKLNTVACPTQGT